jgi:hypothetical protein
MQNATTKCKAVPLRHTKHSSLSSPTAHSEMELHDWMLVASILDVSHHVQVKTIQRHTLKMHNFATKLHNSWGRSMKARTR